jgi:hypothetical protein
MGVWLTGKLESLTCVVLSNYVKDFLHEKIPLKKVIAFEIVARSRGKITSLDSI